MTIVVWGRALSSPQLVICHKVFCVFWFSIRVSLFQINMDMNMNIKTEPMTPVKQEAAESDVAPVCNLGDDNTALYKVKVICFF